METVSRLGGLAVSIRLAAFYPPNRLTVEPSLLIPMDDSQSDHLKAYGVAYRVIQTGGQAEWLLNYRGGSFLVPDGVAIRRDAGLTGVRFEPVTLDGVTAIRGEIAATNADSVPLEKPPKIAVYAPPAPPWDMRYDARPYAGVPLTGVDFEGIGGASGYDCCTHHEYLPASTRSSLYCTPASRGWRRWFTSTPTRRDGSGSPMSPP